LSGLADDEGLRVASMGVAGGRKVAAGRCARRLRKEKPVG